MSVIGYIRVSSNKQTNEHQRAEIKKFAKINNITITEWFEETISSRKPLSKRLLGKILSELKTGDVLIACEISRFGRSLLEIMRILEHCLSRDCNVWTIKENYRLGNDIQSKVLAFAFGLSAEIERNLISQRTKSAMNTLRARGQKLGRPNRASPQTWKLYRRRRSVVHMLRSGKSNRDIATEMEVSHETLRRFIKWLKALDKKDPQLRAFV